MKNTPRWITISIYILYHADLELAIAISVREREQSPNDAHAYLELAAVMKYGASKRALPIAIMVGFTLGLKAPEKITGNKA